VGIIRQGNLVEVATIIQLKQLALKHVELTFTSPTAAENFVGKLPKQLVKNFTVEDTRGRFLSKREDLAHLLPKLADASFTDLNIRDSTLEDIFLEYYGAVSNGNQAKMETKTILSLRRERKRRWFK
jgi:ABC-2 type transport system ATP-binding protein